MVQIYSVLVTQPASFTPVSIVQAVSGAGTVTTLTCGNAAGADILLLQNSASAGLCKIRFRMVGDAVPTSPTAAGTDDATGIVMPFTSANLTSLFYAPVQNGLGKKKILSLYIYTASASATLTASFFNLNTVNVINP